MHSSIVEIRGEWQWRRLLDHPAIGYTSPLERMRGSGSKRPARNLILHPYTLFPFQWALVFPIFYEFPRIFLSAGLRY